MQQSKFLESKTKFSFSNARGSERFQENQFFSWTNNNFYRTSYNDMSSKSPVRKQAAVIPGYKGYVPYVKVNNDFIGKRVTEQARDVLKPDVVDSRMNNYSTTGFNAAVIPKHDDTLHANSRRYGTRTMLNNAPNHHPRDYSATTTRLSYLQPAVHDKPNWRNRNNSLTFENCAKLQVHQKADQHASGYQSNRQLWDSTGWINEKNLHSDQNRSTYRNNFNKEKPFHKPEMRVTDGRLKRKEIFYDGGDNRMLPERFRPSPVKK